MDGRAAERVVRGLGVAGWTAIAIGFVVQQLVAHDKPAVGQNLLVWTLSIFFVVQIVRLATTVWTRRGQRLAPACLLISVLLWAAGSAMLNAGGVPDLTHFPARGELWFLASYVAMAAYLLVSAAGKVRLPLDTWLHVLVICGGAVCVTGFLLFSPVGAAYRGDALGLFLALLYPLIDLVLAVLVIAQALLRLRQSRSASAALITGFLLFGFADSHFVADLSSGTYHFSVLSDAAWGAGFALIVGAACRRPATSARALPRTQGSAETLVAAGIAIAVLPIAPTHSVGVYLTVPAVLTLLGAGGRLVLALREAQGVAEALALSRTDDLTRLPNRRALRADLDDAFETSRPLSLMLLDLDGFKDVNDTLGHTAGDEVLQLMAHRIRQALPPATTVARLGGDEFAVLAFDSDELDAMETAQDLLAELRASVRVDGIEILPSASIGIAVRDATVTSGSELLRRADVAMYQAKQQRLGAASYDPADDDFSKTKLQLAEDLRKALDERQLEMWYQPQVDAATMRVCAVEGLLRWRHPVQGVLSPVAFLPAARQAGLMPALSTRVAALALADMRAFRAAGLDLRVAINCAPPELLSGTFIPDLYRQLDESDVPPDRLVVEVTEDSFMADPERARYVVEDLREHGVQVAIDDYGTGFSSLAYLRDLAVDEVKIDRSFVSAMGQDPRTRMIVSSTVQMAAALSLRTVAEGVEDAECAAELVALGVDVLQGYHVAAPMPAARVAEWIADWRSQEMDRAGAVEKPAASGELAPRPKRSLRVLAGHRGTAEGWS